LKLVEQVRTYWEGEPCGTSPQIVGDLAPMSPEWFERIEEHRYAVEPFIHSIAQFTRHRGKRLLEVGVGAGTDHLQWARAGALCHGVDLTDAAIETTRARLAHYGLASQLRRVDAERLPFEDGSFDVVYSWGVIHHAERPEGVVAEIHRVLRPGGTFVGMLYSRRSLVGLRFWLKFGLLAGRPLRSFADVIWHHMESIGTRAYTRRELRALFGAFGSVQTIPLLTPYDTASLPGWLAHLLPDALGWFIAVRAIK
jgi:ubiquinone/menaquinone biosynthesis C-methylase UbiE